MFVCGCPGRTRTRRLADDDQVTKTSHRPLREIHESRLLTIELVATEARIRRDILGLPAEPTAVERFARTHEFPVALYRIETVLGRWLASHIRTTWPADDASMVHVVLPITEADYRITALAQGMLRLRGLSGHVQIAMVREELSALEGQLGTGDRLAAFRFQWPVYGSSAVDADSAEAYFDACARRIQATGGVVAWAGLNRTPLPDSIARTMATDVGGGLRLRECWRRESQVGGDDRSERATPTTV